MTMRVSLLRRVSSVFGAVPSGAARQARGGLRPRGYCRVVRSPLPTVEAPSTDYVSLLFDKYRRTPEIHHKTAIINGDTDERFSYTEMVQATKSVASALVKLGFRKGKVLCVFSTNCPEFAFTLFGGLSVGGTVTCASSAFTDSELLYQLKDSGSEFLVVSKQLLDVAKRAAAKYGHIKHLIVIGGDGSDGTLPFSLLLDDDGTADPSGQVDFDLQNDVAILPYSSGTTGVPKGVMLSHANISTNLLQVWPLVPCYEMDVSLGILPFYHIYGMIPILGVSLMCGATIVTLPSFNPAQFLDTIVNYQVNILHIVPPIVLFLKDHAMARERDLSHIRLIISAAAPLAEETHQAFIDHMRTQNPHIHIGQAYGLSETSPGVMASPQGWVKPGSTGVLMPNCEAKVMCLENKKGLGPNEEGEIIVRGPNIMLGYLNNQTATDESIKDGWFHTGDVGYYDKQGFFFIIDRVKELIKYKGLQVPPAEMEGLLLSHPDIVDAAVVSKSDERAGELPAAFIVRKDPNSSLTTEEIDAFVTERVADYKRLRGGIFFTDAIPKSASGKILRRLLRTQLNSS